MNAKTKRMPKTPWSAVQIRAVAKKLVRSWGGPDVFARIGPKLQGAVIDQAVMEMFYMATHPERPLTLTEDDIRNTREAMHIACDVEY